ncbi:alpha/beta hydrolase [Streptomyces sp. ISL-36]|uniref:alpha/beta hydrolase n=1 Tax=Streptomyces sp. ISL-36 TaxID=2819182 RepID=UPI001BEC75A1|nr:alpha/beta hydrolase [Streptomyces sp. ISL-36]MBT2442547.1 alpha/beta hydrolase [Streptomyces sp. ISL-36]
MPVEGRLADAVADHRGRLLSLAELPPVPGVDVRERMIPGPAGGPDVRVRIYRPRAEPAALPAVLWIHGGGFCLGNVDSVHVGAAQAALHASAVVVAVSYRLAPEHPYPAGLDDCWAALEWTAGHPGELGADPARVAVAGASSGGALAAGLTLLARERGGPALCFQHLSTPVLDDRLATASMAAFTDTPVWNRRLAEESWQLYLGETAGGAGDGAGAGGAGGRGGGPRGAVHDRDRLPVSAAPARAADLSGLPAAYLSTAGLDPLRDEGLLYGTRLAQAGVPVELHNFPGAYHAFVGGVSPEQLQHIGAEHLRALRAGLHGGGPAAGF